MSRFPPGLRIQSTPNRAAAMQWLGSSNFYQIEKFGRNDGIADGSYDTVLLQGQYPHGDAVERAGSGWLGSGATLYLSSGAVAANNDFVVTIQGLDANGDFQEASAIVNGQNGVPFSGTWDRVFRAWVSSTSIGNTVGIIGGNNVNSIYVGTEAAPVAGVPTTNTTWAKIDGAYPISPNQTEMACYTIPRGYRGYITSFAGAAVNLGNPATDTVCDLLLQTMQYSLPDPSDLTSGIYESFRTREFLSVSSRATSWGQKIIEGAIEVPELTDIRMVGQPAGFAEVFATFELFIVKEE